MTEVLQANVFFFIASVATVIFCIIVSLILFQVYKIVKLVRSILERIESASDTVAEDVAHVRQLVVSGGLVSSLFSLAMGTRRKKRRSKKNEESED